MASDINGGNPTSSIVATSNQYPFGATYTATSTRQFGAQTTFKTITVGFRLTSQQKTDLYNAVLAYNTALGRN